MVDEATLWPVVYPEVISQDILPGPVNPPPAGVDTPEVTPESEDAPTAMSVSAPSSPAPDKPKEPPPPLPISEPRRPQQEPTPPHEPMPPPLSH